MQHARLHPWVQKIADMEELSQYTRGQYAVQVRKVQGMAPGRTLEEILANPAIMLKRIEASTSNLQTKKSAISAMKALIKHNSLQQQYATAAGIWHDAFKLVDDAITARYETAEPTAREVEQWMPWAAVLKKEKELAEREYGSMDHLLLAMYTHVPPQRQDYGNVKLVLEKPQKDIDYLLLPKCGDAPGAICLRHRKTVKKLGVYHADIPINLVKIVVASLRSYPREFLFQNSKGAPFVDKEVFTCWSNNTLRRMFGKQMGVSTLRHSFISSLDFNRLSPAALKGIAYAMGHDLRQQQLYRRLGMRQTDA